MWLNILVWLAQNVQHAPAVIAALKAIDEAEGVPETLDAIKAFLDLVYPFIKEIVGIVVAQDEATVEANAVSALKLGDGELLKKLRPWVELLLPILLDIIRKKAGA